MIKLLKLTTNYCLDLCFDIYESPSIKDIKRKSRGDRDHENCYNVDHLQSLPTDFAELLNMSDLKTRSLYFLFKKHKYPIYGTIIGESVSLFS